MFANIWCKDDHIKFSAPLKVALLMRELESAQLVNLLMTHCTCYHVTLQMLLFVGITSTYSFQIGYNQVLVVGLNIVTD